MQKFKQFLAIFAIVIMVSLYIVTLILSISGNAIYQKFFTASLYATFIVPVMLYLIFWVANLLKENGPHGDKN